MDEDYSMVYGIDKLAELLIERGIEFCVNDGTSLFFMDGSGNPHECWMAGAEENLVNALIVVTPEQLLSVPDLNGIIAENFKLRELAQEMYGFVKDVCELRPDVLMANNVPDWQVTDCRTPSERYADKLRELGIEVDG